MHQKQKSNFEQILPMILQTFIGVIILLIAWLVITALPMINDIHIPLDFTLTELITALILTVIIAIAVSFGIRMELRLLYLGSSFPQGGTMIKQLMYLIGVLIAYYAFKPILMPFFGEYDWVYSLVFLVAFVIVLFLLGYNIYSNMEEVSALFSRSSTGSPSPLTCVECGEKNMESTFYCSFCGRELVRPVIASCEKCGTALKPEARFCAGCGTTVEEAEKGAPEETGEAKCRSCDVVLKPGAHFCAACGSTVKDAETKTESAAGEQAAASGSQDVREAEPPGQPPLCHSCGKQLVEGARFCPLCGSARS